MTAVKSLLNQQQLGVSKSALFFLKLADKFLAIFTLKQTIDTTAVIREHLDLCPGSDSSMEGCRISKTRGNSRSGARFLMFSFTG